jgi:hypothetical protein
LGRNEEEEDWRILSKAEVEASMALTKAKEKARQQAGQFIGNSTP